MTKAEFFRDFMEIFQSVDTETRLDLQREFCENTAGWMDDYIYDISEFDDIMASFSPMEIAHKTVNGTGHPDNAKWFKFDGCGDIEWLSEWDIDTAISVYDLDIKCYLQENPDRLEYYFCDWIYMSEFDE